MERLEDDSLKTKDLENRMKGLKNHPIPPNYDDRFLKKLLEEKRRVKEKKNKYRFLLLFEHRSLRFLFLFSISFLLMFVLKTIIGKPELLKLDPDKWNIVITIVFLLITVSIITIIKIPKYIFKGGY